MLAFSHWVPLSSLNDFCTFLFFNFPISRKLIWNTNLHIVLPWVISSFCPSENRQSKHSTNSVPRIVHLQKLIIRRGHLCAWGTVRAPTLSWPSSVSPAAPGLVLYTLLPASSSPNSPRTMDLAGLFLACALLYVLGGQQSKIKMAQQIVSYEIEMVFKTVWLSAHILSIAPKESAHLLNSVCSVSKTHRFRSHYL